MGPNNVSSKDTKEIHFPGRPHHGQKSNSSSPQGTFWWSDCQFASWRTRFIVIRERDNKILPLLNGKFLVVALMTLFFFFKVCVFPLFSKISANITSSQKKSINVIGLDEFGMTNFLAFGRQKTLRVPLVLIGHSPVVATLSFKLYPTISYWKPMNYSRFSRWIRWNGSVQNEEFSTFKIVTTPQGRHQWNTYGILHGSKKCGQKVWYML